MIIDNMADYVRQLQRFNVGEDCPVFDGLYEFCQIYASGSIGKKYHTLCNCRSSSYKGLFPPLLQAELFG